MRKTYRVHLRSGTTIDIKADDFRVEYDSNGFIEWEAPNVDRWLVFLPSDLVAVERIK